MGFKTLIHKINSKSPPKPTTQKSPRIGIRELLEKYCCRLVCSNHVYAAAFAVKLYLTIGECKKRVVSAATYTNTRMHFRAALTDDDVAGDDCLSAKFLNAEALAA